MSEPTNPDAATVRKQMEESVYWLGFLGNSHICYDVFTIQVFAGSLLSVGIKHLLKGHEDASDIVETDTFIYVECPSLKDKVTRFTESFDNLKCPTFDQGSEDLVQHFLRGLVDQHGQFTMEPTPTLTMRMCSTFSEELLELLQDHLGPFQQTENVLTWTGVTAFDACGYLYKGLDEDYPLVNEHIRGEFQPAFTLKTCYVKSHEDSIIQKARASDSGYDLNLVSLVKQDGNLYYFDTGIAVQPEFGFYFDLVARSSLPKTGYMLANNVGVIDSSYTGTIKVALLKFDLEKPDLVLPFRAVQLIPRPLVLSMVYQVDDLSNTQRGTDGGIVRSIQ